MITTVGLIMIACALLWTHSADAGTIGYWQLDGSAGTTATNVDSEVNAASLTGAASAVGTGIAPTYSSDVAGPYIRDGLNGAIINNNTTSMAFTGAPSTQNGGVVQINDADGTAGLLEAGTYTIEGFYKSSTDQLLSTIVAKQWGAGKYSWGVDTGYSNQNALHFLANQNFSNREVTTSMPTNDGLWHHFAVTYNGTTATIYGDYAQLATVNYTVAYDDRPLLLGNLGDGNAFTGLIDEVRYSDSVLSSDQFLRAVPEPTSMALVGMGMFGLLTRRRRSAA